MTRTERGMRPDTRSTRRRGGTFLALIAAVLMALGAGLGGSASAQDEGGTAQLAGTPEERAAAITEPAVLYLEAYWSTYVNVSADPDIGEIGYLGPYDFSWRCTGFGVTPDGYVVTAGHCVDDGVEGASGMAIELALTQLVNEGIIADEYAYEAWYNDAYAYWTVEGAQAGTPPDRVLYAQHGVAVGGLETGEAWPARLIDFTSVSEGDVALLKVETDDLPVLTLADAADVSIGTQVLSVGYPGSSDEVTDATYEPTFKDGKISSEKTRGDGLLPVYEISAALSGGMSGGPTVNLDGEVVGVNSFSIQGETEAFNFLSPASLVQELLARNGVTNELGPVDELYRAGLISYFAGEYRDASDTFGKVLERDASHQLAQEYRTASVEQAESMPAPAPEGGEGGGLSPLMTGAAALLVVAGGALLVIRTRRRGATAPTTVEPMAPPTAAAVAAPPAAAVAAPPAATHIWPAAEHVPDSEMPAAAKELPDVVHFCSECGQHADEQDDFCHACGHALHKRPQAH